MRLPFESNWVLWQKEGFWEIELKISLVLHIMQWRFSNKVWVGKNWLKMPSILEETHVFEMFLGMLVDYMYFS